MTKFEGGCLCGTVRYVCTGEVLSTVVCYCKSCQKQTGTSFSIVVAVAKDCFAVEGDTLAVFNHAGTSGKSVRRHFCRNCGSPLFTQSELAPDRLFIKAGTLDDTTGLQPQANIWCQSAQPWLLLDHAIPKLEQNLLRD